MERTTVYVKNALSPIPAESAKGKFANKPIKSMAIIDATIVAVKTPPLSIPVSDNIFGFTTKI